MKYFLDSVILDEICYVYENWVIDGVIINFCYVMNSGKFLIILLDEFVLEFRGVKYFLILVEINFYFDDVKIMVEEGRKFVKMFDNFVVKILCIEFGFIVVKEFEKEGIKMNVIFVFFFL